MKFAKELEEQAVPEWRYKVWTSCTGQDETAVVKLHGLRGPPRHTRKSNLLIPYI